MDLGAVLQPEMIRKVACLPEEILENQSHFLQDKYNVHAALVMQ